MGEKKSVSDTTPCVHWSIAHSSKTSLCGDCAVCCIYPSIAELNKKEDDKCPYLGDSGCKIYPTRPLLCKDFTCEWLHYFSDPQAPPGIYKETDRPNLSGLFMECCDEVGIMIHSLWPNAIDEAYGKDLLDRIIGLPVPIVIRDARGPGKHCFLLDGKLTDFTDTTWPDFLNES